MSKIINVPLTEDVALCQGKQITFKAPCDCDGVTGIEIKDINYKLVNTAGDQVDDTNAFTKDALVTVVLDIEATEKKAYIQNGASSGSIFFKTIESDSWEEDEDTGLQKQFVAIDKIHETNNVIVSHSSKSIDTDGYDLFMAEDDEYLNYITNGYARTCNGGINFYVFGEVNTMPIPIVVKVI